MPRAVEQIMHNEVLLAIILRAEHEQDGIEFFTPPDYSQQLGYMKRPAGYVIASHAHNDIQRHVVKTLEALFVKRGKVRILFYGENREPAGERIIQSGDMILLTAGGHGFEMLEETEMIEVKQGPHAGDLDKERFNSEDAP